MRKDCLFCRKVVKRIFESKYFYARYDDYPVREGHILIIPLRHVEDFTALTLPEVIDFHYVTTEMVKRLHVDFQMDGYNIGINCGQAAGQTIPHLHMHLIPRYAGDVPDPRGGGDQELLA